ncbi:MAG: excinuclease ABC subunit UvrC, partial [Oscillospiraceae bacterium]|nr:excinuclease ABC subunit UvrC [Oscillospiraceae bacterium]
GENHAKMALDALRELKLTVPVFGMVKDDRHRTRALVSPDGHEIGINSNQAVFALIGGIQEETHRFAIEYQRLLRNEGYASALDKIEGVGPKRRADLIKYFKSIKAIKVASVSQLRLVVPKNTAQAVYDYFHNGEEKCE